MSGFRMIRGAREAERCARSCESERQRVDAASGRVARLRNDIMPATSLAATYETHCPFSQAALHKFKIVRG